MSSSSNKIKSDGSCFITIEPKPKGIIKNLDVNGKNGKCIIKSTKNKNEMEIDNIIDTDNTVEIEIKNAFNLQIVVRKYTVSISNRV